MMKHPAAIFPYLLLAILALPQTPMAKQTITWLEATFPPYFIHQGEYKNQGYGDAVTDILIQHLDHYAHKRMAANISRHYRMYKRGENVCSVGLYKKPEREEFLHFSIPSFVTLPNVIVINRKKYDAFGGKNMVSLGAVLQNNSLIIGQAKNRSYGRIIDTLFEEYGNASNVFVYEGRSLSLNFFQMLKRDRLDGIIGLPEEVLYQAENLGIRDQIMTLAIEENQQSMDAWLSHVVCSKTSWGKKVIDDVNRVLRQQRPTKAYRAAYERWLDKASIPRYREAYRKYFLSVTD
ncbi:MAG: TIGR02285 family protein [Desulfopila sp.]